MEKYGVKTVLLLIFVPVIICMWAGAALIVYQVISLIK